MKVICIKDDGYDVVHQMWIENYPKKGEVYTVRKRVHSVNGLGYLLQEITNPIMANGMEPSFNCRRFEPLVLNNEKKTTAQQLASSLTILFVIFLCASVRQTAVFAQIPVYQKDSLIKYTMPAQSFYVKVPIRYIHDTVYLPCPETPKPIPKEFRWSNFTGTFQQFIDSAIASKQTAYIDKDVTPLNTVSIDGDITLIGNGCTVTSINKTAFVLGAGKHTFKNFNIIQTKPDGIAFFTKQIAGILWTNYVQNVNIDGGGEGYSSSRGGNDTSWAGTTIENSIIKVRSGGIGVFSQDGPYKYLHLKNVQIQTDTTHNIYVHPNVSLYFDSVASLGVKMEGKLMMHQHSGGNPQFYNSAKYSVFKKVYCNGEMFEMTNPKSGYVQIDSSEIAPYVAWGGVAKVWATNSRFYNAGNGIFLSGTLYNCSGGAWTLAGDTLRLVGGNYSEVSMRGGGMLITDNTKIQYMSVADRGNDFEGHINNSTMKFLYDEKKGNGILYLFNTPKPATYGYPYRPDIIQNIVR